MKGLKFGFKLFMAMLPLIIYVLLFVKYEPYNYFGLQEQAKKFTSPLGRMREFMRNPSENIVLGDSRMNHVDLDLSEQLTGERWATLATGGQTPKQTYALYEWAKTKVNVQNVIMDVSFYQVRSGNTGSELGPTIYIAEHPLEYIVTRDYVMEAFSPWLITEAEGEARRAEKVRVEASKAGSESEEMKDNEAVSMLFELVEEEMQENKQKYREDLVEYALYNIYPGCENYSIAPELLGCVIDIIKDVHANGGDVKVLAPVVQESIWEYVIIPLNIEPFMEEYKNEIAKYTTLYDMEWQSELSEKQEIFADGFHFIDEETYQIYTRNLFRDTEEFVLIRDDR